MIVKKSTLFVSLLLTTLAFVSCSTDEKVEALIEMAEDQLLVYEEFENVQFEVDTEGLDSKRFFATSTGELYTYNELNAEIGPTIDLVWYDMSPTNPGFLFWDNPSDLSQDEPIEGATSTKMENNAELMSVAEFDAITEASQLTGYTVVNQDEAMGPIEYPEVVLFENAAGHIGAIKMKSNDGQLMIVDIKVARQ